MGALPFISRPTERELMEDELKWGLVSRLKLLRRDTVLCREAVEATSCSASQLTPGCRRGFQTWSLVASAYHRRLTPAALTSRSCSKDRPHLWVGWQDLT